MIVFFFLTRKSATSFFNPNWHEAGRIYPPYIFWIGFCQLNFHQKPGVYSILSVDAMPLSLKNLLLNRLVFQMNPFLMQIQMLFVMKMHLTFITVVRQFSFLE